jgi:hypothetical protein
VTLIVKAKIGHKRPPVVAISLRMAYEPVANEGKSRAEKEKSLKTSAFRLFYNVR